MVAYQTPLLTQQIWIGAQLFLSSLLQLYLFLNGAELFDISGPVFATPQDKIYYIIHWQFWATTILLVMILTIAGIRPLFKDVIDGNDSADRLAIQVRIQRNTLEQLILFLVGTTTLATMLPEDQLNLIGTLTLMFIFFRILFWVGYTIRPHFRTFGFVGTFYPNIAVIGYCSYKLLI